MPATVPAYPVTSMPASASPRHTPPGGNGPFPTEIPSSDPSGSHMATIGHEFGTTTGRPRRTGWLDIPALMEAQRVNGFTGLVLTKLDVLAGLEEIKICIGYEMDGRPMTMLPARAEDVARCMPVYETHEGFKSISEEEWLDMAQKSNDEKMDRLHHRQRPRHSSSG